MSAFRIPDDGRLRLFSFAGRNGDARVGAALSPVAVFDVAEAMNGSHPDFDVSSMLSLIETSGGDLAGLRQSLAVGARGKLDPLALSLLPPIPKLTRNIYCVGWNYLDHFEEGKTFRDTEQALPEHPVFFSKAVNTVNGPFAPIPYDAGISTKIDWEVELAVIVGKRGRNIPEGEAMSYVFGYTAVNDVSARDLQSKRHGGQWFKGKSLDGHAPMGPFIVPAAELDPANIHLKLRVNGEAKQDASTAQMHFKVPRIIAELSRGLTLEAGDVIATGTPPGVGFARKPPEWLKPGDVMETEIVEIGAMRNVIGG